MLRLVEILLFLSPFAVFAMWRFFATEGEPSLHLVVIAVCIFVLLAGTLVWLSQEDSLPPGSQYAPARLEDGKVVSGHAAPE